MRLIFVLAVFAVSCSQPPTVRDELTFCIGEDLGGTILMSCGSKEQIQEALKANSF